MKSQPLLPSWLLGLTIIAFLCAMLVTMGCASMDYQWQQTRTESAKPWFYVRVENPDALCRSLGADSHGRLDRILACAQWKSQGCTIYLAKDAPQWIIEHEEKHCAGWTH